MIIASYLIAGIFAGLTAGLFGVGGGLIVVPILVLVFQWQNFPAETLTHMAVATSLATIIFTSASSIWSHQQKNAVLWPVFKPISVGIVLGAILGVFTVIQMEGELLKKLFGLFAILVALKMMVKIKLEARKPLPANPVLFFAGIVIAWVSSIFGIGGGTLSVPFLSRYRIKMTQVVGTSAACGLPIALFATISNILVGLNQAGLPSWSAGYVYLPALAGIVVTSMFSAKLGAHLAHYLPGHILTRLFALFLILVGINFLI